LRILLRRESKKNKQKINDESASPTNRIGLLPPHVLLPSARRGIRSVVFVVVVVARGATTTASRSVVVERRPAVVIFVVVVVAVVVVVVVFVVRLLLPPAPRLRVRLRLVR
jgi:hypothetical protein